MWYLKDHHFLNLAKVSFQFLILLPLVTAKGGQKLVLLPPVMAHALTGSVTIEGIGLILTPWSHHEWSSVVFRWKFAVPMHLFERLTSVFDVFSRSGLRLAENHKVDLYNIFWNTNLIIGNLSYLAGINTEPFENHQKTFRISRKSIFTIKFFPPTGLSRRPAFGAETTQGKNQ